MKSSFQVGKGFDETTLDGRNVHALLTLNGTTLTEVQTEHGIPRLLVERKFSPDHVVIKVQLKNITSYRVYDAV